MTDIDKKIKRENNKAKCFLALFLIFIIASVVIFIILDKKYNSIVAGDMKETIKTFYVFSLLLIMFVLSLLSFLSFLKVKSNIKKLRNMKIEAVHEEMNNRDMDIKELKSKYDSLRLYILLDIIYVFAYMFLLKYFYSSVWHLFLILICIYFILIIKKVKEIKAITNKLK